MAPSPDVPWHERRLQSYNVHKQHYFLDQFPESRKMMMQLHAKRAARYEYLQPKGTPGGDPMPFDFEKYGTKGDGLKPPEKRIHNVVDAVEKDTEGGSLPMRMVLIDGKWKLMT